MNFENAKSDYDTITFAELQSPNWSANNLLMSIVLQRDILMICKAKCGKVWQLWLQLAVPRPQSCNTIYSKAFSRRENFPN